MTTTIDPPAARSSANKVTRHFAQVRLDCIVGFPYNYRQDFGGQSLEDLADSIREQGIIEPIILQQDPEDPRLHVGLAGERRFRAAKLAALSVVPAMVYTGLSEQGAIEIALVENLQRKDVNPIEEAAGYRMLKDKAGLKQNEIAERVGRPRSTVANTMRLLDLPQSVQDHIAQGRLTKAHGVALLRFRGYYQVIEIMAKLAVEQETPAGTLEEEEVPFSSALCNRELLVTFPSWKIRWDEHLHRAIKEDTVEAPTAWKFKAMQNELDTDYYLLDVTREKKVLERAAYLEQKAIEEEEAAEQREEEEAEADPQVSEELQKAREERDAEEKARAEAFENACERVHAYWKWHDKKGPTGGSRMNEWDGMIKAMFLISDCEDMICDIDDDLLKEVLPKDFDLEKDDNWESILNEVLKAPAHQIVELLIRDRLRAFTNQQSSYYTKQIGRMLDHLEASKR